MSSLYPVIAAFLACAFLGASPGWTASVVAQIGPEEAVIEDHAGDVLVTVPLSEPVPWKVRLVDDPARVMIEFSEVDWTVPPTNESTSVVSVETGRFAPEWSQMTLTLREPLVVNTAEMETLDGGGATLRVSLVPATAGDFRALAEEDAAQAAATHPPDEALVVAIDAGHGGFDPGAEAGGLVEADLMLFFAQRLQEELIRTGKFQVVMTRDEDVFVPLETRLTIAREAGADVFVSLHADTVEADAAHASGMTVYTLPEGRGDAASERLTERHAESDILSGADLSGAGDDVALALLDLARQDTQPRAAALSAAIVAAFQAAELVVNSHAERQAELAVLKSADMPSVLVELGFLSSQADVERLGSEPWQQEAVRALRNALLIWTDEDRLRSEVMRR